MPLLDHFHPPLSRDRYWDSFHTAWAEAIAATLNGDLLPERFYAEAHVKIGPRAEIDVATLEEHVTRNGDGGVALWAPPKPALSAKLDFAALDQIEIRVFNDEEGPRLVAAIELVSPGNKDRASQREMLAVKCASYLHQGISLILIDIVTKRKSNLHRELLELLRVEHDGPGQGDGDLYAVAYRTILTESETYFEMWPEDLRLGEQLPTLPLWLGPELVLPLDLEDMYRRACAARRIRFD